MSRSWGTRPMKAVSGRSVPAVPGCVSQGETMEELLVNMREAIQARVDIPSARGPEPEALVRVENRKPYHYNAA